MTDLPGSIRIMDGAGKETILLQKGMRLWEHKGCSHRDPMQPSKKRTGAQIQAIPLVDRLKLSERLWLEDPMYASPSAALVVMEPQTRR